METKDFIVYETTDGRTIKVSEVLSPSHLAEFVFLRSIIAHHLRERKWTYRRIALALHRRNHATMINAVRAYDFLSKHHQTFKVMESRFNTDIIDKILTYDR